MFTSLGLMSGTSMDGIDVALMQTDGKKEVIEMGYASLAYDSEFQILLKAAEYTVNVTNGDLIAAEHCYLQLLTEYLAIDLSISVEKIALMVLELNNYFQKTAGENLSFPALIRHSTQLHAYAVKKLLAQTGHSAMQVDVIGYHGQTLFHRPANKITVQVGDGKLLAKLTGIAVINDFRSHDVAAGGQGAPLAPLYHQALISNAKYIPAAVVNCGGIANISVIGGEALTDVIGFDTGPGNVLLDRYVRQKTHGIELIDTDGQYGSKGYVNLAVLEKLYCHAVNNYAGVNYFDAKPPKSLDARDCFLIPELDDLSLVDGCRTLAAFTADSIVRSVEHLAVIPTYWVLAGGGWYNPVICAELTDRLGQRLGASVQIKTAAEFGWQNKALEAQLFAYLAVRSLLKLPISLPFTTGVPQPLTGGVLHSYSK